MELGRGLPLSTFYGPVAVRKTESHKQDVVCGLREGTYVKTRGGSEDPAH